MGFYPVKYFMYKFSNFPEKILYKIKTKAPYWLPKAHMKNQKKKLVANLASSIFYTKSLQNSSDTRCGSMQAHEL